MRKATALGHKRAELELAEILAKSPNEKDVAESITICVRLSDFGDKDAMFRLSRLYKEEKQRQYWLKKAAAKGHNGAIKELNANNKKQINSEKEITFVKNLNEAKKGNIKHMIWVARAYKTGDGVDKNIEEAYNWYEKCIKITDCIDMEFADLIYFNEIITQIIFFVNIIYK